MNVQEVIEAFRNGLMWIGLWALAVLAVCALLSLIAKRKQVRPVFAHIPPVQCAVLLVVMAVCTLFSGKNTNSPPAGIMSPILPHSTGGTPIAPVVVTPEEITQGWRLESVTTNDAVSYAMPTNGVEYAPWTLRGGYETHFALDLGDFAFPFGTGVVHRLDVLSGGMVESLPRQRVDGAGYSSMMSISAAREWASIVPGVGRFWWADAAGTAGLEAPPYRAKVLTWENVYAGRDRTGQYSAQIELWGDGNFTTRSNNVECVYRRVLPFDLDNDGLPNDIDPAPETPLVPSAWNQGEAWAAAAFPSNAAEIAAMGGYAAWVAARGADPDRRLVTLGVSFDDGSAWPALLDFGGVPVVADGGAELSFAIDCGAKVPFSLTSGRFGSVTVSATDPPTRSGEGLTTTESSEFQGNYGYPHERTVNDVKVHLDDPRSGWLCRTANVSVEPSWLPHFFPGDSAELTASVTNCHPNAYLGCSWTGGEGIQFSDPNSLSTTVTYDSTSTVEWATNSIDLITQFVGYSLTNHVHFTVGTTNEPNTELSISCPHVMFLNDLHNGKRAERVYSVSLMLSGPHGIGGHVSITSISGAELRLFYDDALSEPATNAIPVYVPDEGLYEMTTNLYLACTTLGNGMLRAEIVLDGGETKTAVAACRVIEPIRRFVTTEQAADGRFLNPSRLVWGTNAVLKVGVNTGTASFPPSEIRWSVVSGPGTLFPTNGLQTVLTPTADSGTVVVEARFNDDEIQPRFVIPIEQPRIIYVQVFVIEPPDSGEAPPDDSLSCLPWLTHEVEERIAIANNIFTQYGIQFCLTGIVHNAGSDNDWVIKKYDISVGADGKKRRAISSQMNNLMAQHPVDNGIIGVFLAGHIKDSLNCSGRTNGFQVHKYVVLGRDATKVALAHEFGHVLGLFDCYYLTAAGELIQDGDMPVSFRCFASNGKDWWIESGRGFYGLADDFTSVMRRLLMYGEDTGEGYDIPAGWIRSLRKQTFFEDDFIQAPVGSDYINPDVLKEQQR